MGITSRGLSSQCGAGSMSKIAVSENGVDAPCYAILMRKNVDCSGVTYSHWIMFLFPNTLIIYYTYIYKPYKIILLGYVSNGVSKWFIGYISHFHNTDIFWMSGATSARSGETQRWAEGRDVPAHEQILHRWVGSWTSSTALPLFIVIS